MTQGQVQMIQVDQITVINPRARNKKVFREIVGNIAEIGLKRPITVASRPEGDAVRYDLVCGQGRLEAYQALGQREIPALIIQAETNDCLVMSLVENLARRHRRSLDLLHDIDGLKKRGYRDSEIAAKTGLTLEYVKLRPQRNGLIGSKAVATAAHGWAAKTERTPASYFSLNWGSDPKTRDSGRRRTVMDAAGPSFS